MFDLALPFSLGVFLPSSILCIQAFIHPLLLQAHHVCDVGRSFVSMLELSRPLLLLSSLLRTFRLLIIIQICERLRFGAPVSLVFVFYFSLFIRGHLHPRMPPLLALSDYTHLLWLFCKYRSMFSIWNKRAMLSPWVKFLTPPEGNQKGAVYQISRRFATTRAAKLSGV